MGNLPTSILISAVTNTVSLLIAAALFDGFDITWRWLIAGVVLFTVLTVTLRSLVIRTINRFTRGYTIVGGLVLTALALLLTDWVVPASGFEIDGWGTWVGVVLIVWAAGIAYGEVDHQAPPSVPGQSPSSR